MSLPAKESEPRAGWGPPLVKHFLEARDWGAVQRFYEALVAGDVGVDQLGLALSQEPASTPKPGPTARRGTAAGDPSHGPAAGQPAPAWQPPPLQEPQEQQQPQLGGGQANATAEVGLQRAAPARRPLERATFKVHCAYFGPAFCGWQWVQQECGESVEQAAQAALRQLLQQRAAAAAAAAAGAERGQQGQAAAPDAAAAASGGGSRSQEEARAVAAAAGGCQRSVGRQEGRQRQRPPGGAVVLSVAGRTDRGVHALGQVFSFYSWDAELTPEDVLRALNGARPRLLRAWHAAKQPRSFHASFSAQWRRYLYLLPLRRRSCHPAAAAAAAGVPAAAAAPEGGGEEGVSKSRRAIPLTAEEAAAVEAAGDVDVERFAALLAALEGRLLDYTAFARDTPPGKDTRCRLLRARAWRASLPDAGATPVLAVVLVGDRFLRRMVRVLVATAAREATPAAACFSRCSTAPPVQTAANGAAGGGDGASGGAGWQEEGPAAVAGAGALLRVAASRDRRASAPAAPAEGLCFLEAGYAPFACG